MSRPRTAQELIHWLDAGAGARWLRRAAFLALALVLSLRVGWTQFRGPQTEATLIQAETGMPVRVAENPLFSVVLGSGYCLEQFDTLRQVLVSSPGD